MNSIRHIHQLGGINKSCIHRPTPLRLIGTRVIQVVALHTGCIQLGHITIRSGGVDLNRVGDLVAIHRLREMNLEWDRFRGDHTKVMPWGEFGDDWCGSYEFIF